MKSQEIGGKDITWYYTEYNYTDYMSIPAQTWVHEIVGNSKDVSIVYEIQEIGGKDITWYYTEYNYTDYMRIPAQMTVRVYWPINDSKGIMTNK